jgi:hypothetical protein
VRGTLETFKLLNDQGADVASDTVVGYESARRRFYTFSGLTRAASAADIEARIVIERQKPRSSQGAETFGRELRRTLKDMGWLDNNAQLTPKGVELLLSQPVSVEEQALLVEALLQIQATNRDGSQPNHPVMTMLRLLARGSSLHRQGLELMLEPTDDGDAEFARIASLYDMTPSQRVVAHPISDAQRANAVKIFPTLAVYAGLIVEWAGLFSLSQDGWTILGQTPVQAAQSIRRHRGRRTTVGRVVKASEAGRVRPQVVPRTLSAEEQARAAARRDERTADHQTIVRRVSQLIGDGRGLLLEDNYSYDLLWIPSNDDADVVLFEMKTVITVTDAYIQARRAHAQLSFYDYFHVRPTVDTRGVKRVVAFDADIPDVLTDYLTHENVAVMVSTVGGEFRGLNDAGVALVSQLLTPQAGA